MSAKNVTKTELKQASKQQKLSLHQLELYRYYLDIFIYNDTKERMAFIKEHGALLERLAVFFSQKAA